MRLFFKSCVFAAMMLAVGVDSSVAQVLDVAPIEVWARTRIDYEGPFRQLEVGTQRAMPVFDLLPQVTADSYFDMLRVVVGAENDPDRDKTRFRYRITGLETEIQKSPWGTHFSFLDYNASGMEDLWADWISVSAGPGFHIPAGNSQFVVRAMGHAAFTTFRFGDIVFEELGDPAGNSNTGVVYGVSGRVSFVWSGRFTARAMYDKKWSAAGPSPVKEQLRFRVDATAGKGWGLFGTFERIDAELADATQMRSAFGGGIKYTVGTEPQ
jgi:hypothetical protein